MAVEITLLFYNIVKKKCTYMILYEKSTLSLVTEKLVCLNFINLAVFFYENRKLFLTMNLFRMVILYFFTVLSIFLLEKHFISIV